MADRYRTPDGWTVEAVQLATGDRLRIRHHGFYIADVANVDDLARWIPTAELAQLEREPDTLIRPPDRSTPAAALRLVPRPPAHGRAPLSPAPDGQVPWPPRALSAGGRAVARRPVHLGRRL